MNTGEITYLIKKKEREGKSPTTILREIKHLHDSGIVMRTNDSEIKHLNKKIINLEKKNKKLMDDNFKLGLKTKPIRVTEYYDQKFPKSHHLRKVKLVMDDYKKPVTMSEIGKLAYGVKLGCVRDCLMVLYFQGEVLIKDNKYCLKNGR